MEFDSEENELKRKHPWKKIGYVFGGSFALCLAVYFLVTSSFFVRRVFFRQIEERLDAKIEVAQMSVSPFRSGQFREVSVVSNDGKFSFTVDEFDLTANLYHLSQGELQIKKLTLNNPRLDLRELEIEAGQNPAPASSNSSARNRFSKLIEGLDVGEFSVENGSMEITTESSDDRSLSKLVIEGISFLINDFSKGKSGSIKLTANAEFQETGLEKTSRWSAEIESEHTVQLDRLFFPETIQGHARITVSDASEQFEILRGNAVELLTDISDGAGDSDISLLFSKNGSDLGGLKLQGPINLEDRDARLRIETQGIDRNILNLFFAGTDWDVTDSRVHASGNLDVSRKGALAILSADISGENLSLTGEDGNIEPFQLKTSFQLDADLEQQTVLIRRFEATGEQQSETILSANLDRPMNLSFGGSTQGFREASINVAWQQIDFEDWKPVFGDVLAKGRSSGSLILTAQNDGKRIAFDGDSSFEKFTLDWGNTRMSESDARVEILGAIENYENLKLELYRTTIIHSGRPLIQSEGSGNYNAASGIFRVRSESEFDLKELLAVYPVADVSAETGRINSNLNYFSDGGASELTGNVVIEKLSGEVLGFQPNDLHAIIDTRIERKQNEIVIRNSSVKLREGLKDGGLVNVSGEFSVPDFIGKLDLRFVGLKEPALKLLDQRLLGLGLNYSETQVSGEVFSIRETDQSLQFKNQLQFTSRENPFSEPLKWDIQSAGVLLTNEFRITDGKLVLPPTEKAAKNDVIFSASVPLNATGSAGTQEATLSGDQVDLTEFSKLVSSLRTETGTSPLSPAPKIGNDGNTDSNFVLKLGFKELIYDQLVIGSITNTIWSGDGKIRVPEIQTTLNGSPVRVSATIPEANSATGFEFKLHSNALPVKEVAASLFHQSNPLLNGNANVDVSLHSGPPGSVFEKLNGNVKIDLTEAKIDVAAPTITVLLLPVSQLLNLPELMLYPIEEVALDVDISNGMATVKKLNANSGLFQAAIEGKFQLSENVLQSPLNLPLSFSLERNVAEEANLVTDDDNTNEAYVKLRDFIRIGGTLSAPVAKISNVVSAAATGARVFGVDPEEIEKIEKPLEAINEILNILGGPKIKLGF